MRNCISPLTPHPSNFQGTRHGRRTHEIEQLERVDELIRRNDIRFIRLQFSDIIGITKHVTIPIGQWVEATEHGVWFDGSSIEGFARIAESDMYLVPDLTTFAVIPWEMDAHHTRHLRCLYTGW